MKLKNILFALVALIVIGGFGMLVTTDVKIEQKPVSKTLSNDRFFEK